MSSSVGAVKMNWCSTSKSFLKTNLVGNFCGQEYEIPNSFQKRQETPTKNMSAATPGLPYFNLNFKIIPYYVLSLYNFLQLK